MAKLSSSKALRLNLLSEDELIRVVDRRATGSQCILSQRGAVGDVRFIMCGRFCVAAVASKPNPHTGDQRIDVCVAGAEEVVAGEEFGAADEEAGRAAEVYQAGVADGAQIESR